MTVNATNEIQSAAEAAAGSVIATAVEAALRQMKAEHNLPAHILCGGALQGIIMIAIDNQELPEVGGWLQSYADALKGQNPPTADSPAASCVILPFPNRSK